MAKRTDGVLRGRLAAHLRQEMERQGWAQADLARALRCHPSVVSHLLLADRTMGLDLFARVHSRLGLDANRLLDEDPPARFFEPGAGDGAAGELAALARVPGLPPGFGERLERIAGGLRRRKAPAARR